MSALPSYEERAAWFHEARFGMFVHYGLYALIGRGEWSLLVERLPLAEYRRLADRFAPERFDADALARLAVEAGMKYLVFTARHHDGFCLYDSAVSDFTSVKTAARRDFTREVVEACRRHGLRVGLYYSLLDWRYPGYFDRVRHAESAVAMVVQAHAQVRELMTQYGPVDSLWYDGGWLYGDERADDAAFWRARELNAMVRRLQPRILINNRSGIDEDLDTPEQHVAEAKPGRCCEACMTIGDFCGWGYLDHNPNLKSVTQLIQHLVNAAAGDSNFLLNIGPRPDGTVQQEFVERLRAIGAWMRVNGDSIYGTRRAPMGWGCRHPLFWPVSGGMLGQCTVRGTTVYWHIFRWPAGEARLSGVKNRVLSARLLAGGRPLRVEQTPSRVVILRDLPAEPPDPHDAVIALELDGPPEAERYLNAPLE